VLDRRRELQMLPSRPRAAKAHQPRPDQTSRDADRQRLCARVTFKGDTTNTTAHSADPRGSGTGCMPARRFSPP
jgi:hypothetical protein